jgi:hypothetical protein
MEFDAAYKLRVRDSSWSSPALDTPCNFRNCDWILTGARPSLLGESL